MLGTNPSVDDDLNSGTEVDVSGLVLLLVKGGLELVTGSVDSTGGGAGLVVEAASIVVVC